MLLSPFIENDFMAMALFAGALFALSATWVGFFLSLRKLSLVGDAISHALLPGIGLSFLIFGASSLSLFFGGVGIGALVSLVLSRLAFGDHLSSDRRIGGFLLFLSALGVLLLGAHLPVADFHQILFGSLLTVGPQELTILLIVFIFCSFVFFFFRRSLFFEILDPNTFHRVSKQGAGMRFLLFFMTTLVLSAGVSFLGALLVVGLLILPSAAAQEWSRSWRVILILSAVFALLSVYAGLLASFYWDLLPGPSTVAAAGFIFILSPVLKNLFSSVRPA